MEIKLNLSSFNDVINPTDQKPDIFDLDMNSTELKIAHHETAPLTSMYCATRYSYCCQGTGNSYCC